MASVNKVILVGNLGRDPEMRYMPNGEAVCNFSIATTDSWKDKSGQKQERTEWHNIVMYRKLAEIAGEYLKKGRPVYVEGRLQTRKWQTKEGQDRYTTEIIADQMQMLGGRDGGGSNTYEVMDEDRLHLPLRRAQRFLARDRAARVHLGDRALERSGHLIAVGNHAAGRPEHVDGVLHQRLHFFGLVDGRGVLEEGQVLLGVEEARERD